MKAHRETLSGCATASRRRRAGGARRPSSTAADRAGRRASTSRTTRPSEAIEADEDAAVEAATVVGAAEALSRRSARGARRGRRHAGAGRAGTRAGRMRACDWLVDWIRAQHARRRRLERAPADHLHRMGGHAALARAAAARSARGHRPRRRAHRHLHRRHRQDGARSVKRAFNADPAKEPLRILLCTDAAREGINLQTRCADLVHFDLPWNPSRLEQRNGRIDRKLQPAKEVVLPLLPLRAARGGHRARGAGAQDRDDPRRSSAPPARCSSERIARAAGERPASPRRGRGARREDRGRDRRRAARRAPAREMDDERARAHERLLQEQQDAAARRWRTRASASASTPTISSASSAWRWRGRHLARPRRAARPSASHDLRVSIPPHPAFAQDAGWDDAFDELRRAARASAASGSASGASDAPVRAIAFEPPAADDGRDAPRASCRSISSTAWSAGCCRASVAGLPGGPVARLVIDRPRGAAARRADRAASPSTAPAPRACTRRSSRSRRLERGRARRQAAARRSAQSGEETTLDQLEEALRDAPRRAADRRRARVQALVERDIADLRADARATRAERRAKAPRRDLPKRGEREAEALAELLEGSASGSPKAARRVRPDQLAASGCRRARSGASARPTGGTGSSRLARLETELASEPARVRAAYEVACRSGWSRSASSISGRRPAERDAPTHASIPTLEWLDHVQPVGLVVGADVLRELGLAPVRQTPARHGEAVADARRRRTPTGPALHDPWAFFEQVLGWEARHVAGSAGRAGAARRSRRAPARARHDAGADLGGRGTGAGRRPLAAPGPHRAAGIDPDARGALDGWEATPHQRFERLLRETGVGAGDRCVDATTRAAARLRAARRDLRLALLPAARARHRRRPADARRAEAAARPRSACSPTPPSAGCRRC